MRSEAELASVLGHEFGHFEARHTLAKFGRRSNGDLLSWASVLAAMSYTPQAQYDATACKPRSTAACSASAAIRSATPTTTGSAISTPARWATWAGHRLRCRRAIIEEARQSAAACGLKPRLDRVAFFASHPAEADARTPRHAHWRHPSRPRWRGSLCEGDDALVADIPRRPDQAQRFRRERACHRGARAQRGWTAWLWLARGDLYRGRGSPRDLVNAHGNSAATRSRSIRRWPMPIAASACRCSRPTCVNRTGSSPCDAICNSRPDAGDAGMIRMLVPEGQGE